MLCCESCDLTRALDLVCSIPAHKISIITTYNGQKELIRDVLNHRCAKCVICAQSF